MVSQSSMPEAMIDDVFPITQINPPGQLIQDSIEDDRPNFLPRHPGDRQASILMPGSRS